MKIFIINLILFGCLCISRANQVPKVKTPLGGIQGYYKVSQNGRQYEAYEGIPYALPPVGKLRFKPPQKVPAWKGDLLATKYGSSCLQYVRLPLVPNEFVEGSEDCLYLNVYRPEKNALDNLNMFLLPVIIWIHGGYFMYGGAKLYGPQYIMDKDVVLVTINYRVGPLGFLSTEDEVVPGNNGLKDQSMAIRWVSENIEWFGGNPEKITLVGLSAGGASVHYHYLSPMSVDLFQGGISLSGTALLPWAQTEGALTKAKKLGAILGCPTSSNREMILCLRLRPAHSIVQAVEKFLLWHYTPYTLFGPVVEKSGDQYFINRSPAEIIKSGDVQDIPWVTGLVSEEGLYPTGGLAADKEKLKQLDKNWEFMAPSLLDLNYTVPREKHSEVCQSIRKHYFGVKSISRLTVKELVQMAGDRQFVVDGEKAARMQAKANQSPVWFYYFSYRGAHSYSELLSGSSENFGVCHGDDAFYVVSLHGVNTTSIVDDREMQKDLLDIWITFANEREPKVSDTKWKPVNPSNKKLNYLHILGPKQFRMEGNTNLGEKDFWQTIDFEENKVNRVSTNNKSEL